MRKYHIISTADGDFRQHVVERIDDFTKPKGSLGRLEELALQVCMIQRTLRPSLLKPANIVFCADHGITAEGVSPAPKEVSYQQTLNIARGGAGINFLCRQHGFQLMIVDAGIDADLSSEQDIVDMKIGRGTRNFRYDAAMSSEEMELCLSRGGQCVEQLQSQGCNVISFGEMGIGNTSASSLWMSTLCGIPLNQCVGAGCGLQELGVQHKLQVLEEALKRFPGEHGVEEIMRRFGGFEMVMAVGAMLRAAELRMLILVDGFIMSVCMLAASRLHPEILDYAVFGHQSGEKGHALLLKEMQVRPLLQLDLRLGEGSGAVCAYPILLSAVNMMNEMETFSHAEVTPEKRI